MKNITGKYIFVYTNYFDTIFYTYNQKLEIFEFMNLLLFSSIFFFLKKLNQIESLIPDITFSESLWTNILKTLKAAIF